MRQKNEPVEIEGILQKDAFGWAVISDTGIGYLFEPAEFEIYAAEKWRRVRVTKRRGKIIFKFIGVEPKKVKIGMKARYRRKELKSE